MAKHEKFRLADPDQLRAELGRLGVSLPVDGDLSILAEPLGIGVRTVPNRFLVQPMEGFDAEAGGGPGELTFRRYRRYAKGGSGFIWFEATAVVSEGRSNPRQLYLHRGSLDGFKRLVEASRRAPVLVLQLTHSGRRSRPAPFLVDPDPTLDPSSAGAPPATDGELDRLQEAFVEAARLAAEAGFDGVDLKSCHRYFISDLLAAFGREGRYGGPFENRARFLLETMARIRSEVPGVFVTTRMSAYDGIAGGFGVDVRGGIDLREPVMLARRLAEAGVPVLNLSIGVPWHNPHLGRPYDRPLRGEGIPQEHPLEGVERFVRITRAIQEAVPQVPVVASGYGWLRHLMPHVAAGVIRSGGAALIGQGRGAFAYPDSPRDVLKTGRMDSSKCCVTCSCCVQIMRGGGETGCVARDAGIYVARYKRSGR